MIKSAVSILVRALIVWAVFSTSSLSATESKKDAEAVIVRSDKEERTPFDVRDKLRRMTPRSTYTNFMRHALAGRYEVAAGYLDLNGLRPDLREQMTPEQWASYMLFMLDYLFARTPELSNSPEGSQDDGVPPSLEWLADVRVNNDYAEITMRRVNFGDGTQVWLFSAETLERLPELYEEYGYASWEQGLVDLFDGRRLLGVGLWFWLVGIVSLAASLVVAWVVVSALHRMIRIKDERYSSALRQLLFGPSIAVLVIFLFNLSAQNMTLDATVRALAQVAPLRIGAWAWFISRLFQFGFIFLDCRYRSQGREVAAVLLRPLLTTVRIIWYISVVLYVFHRAGFNISTMIAGLGIGGMAVALASQDTLKNLFGSLMILADKPFIVGQRIVVNGYDGVVEEIGLRSTRLRLLNGHQATVPNDIISRVEIENIGSRPFIRCLMKVTLPFDMTPEKLEASVNIAEDLLADHEGMKDEFPPRVYLNEVAEVGFKLMIIFWYHPADYWSYQAYCQEFNLSLAKRFEEAGIRFALPAQDLYMHNASTAGESS